MRGAPEPGLAKLIMRMRLRISRDLGGRPLGPRLFHVQYSRNPLRFQAITVSAFINLNTRAPALPQTRQPDPEDAIDCVKLYSPTLSRALQHQKLMAQGQDLRVQFSACAK